MLNFEHQRWYPQMKCLKIALSLKVRLNLGLYKQILKSPNVGLFLMNHAESNFHKRIPVNENLGFHKKMLISQICCNEYKRAKRVP